LQEESLPNKRRIIKKEKKGKGARNKRENVKPHLLIQGHEKLHEKKEREKERMRTSSQVGETF
jgi:hypothetical protein